MTQLEVHPVADLFPMLAEDELAELAEDIRSRGLLQPVVLDADGRVLDGRNRLAACRLAGVEPGFTTYDGGDPDGYALAVNIARRHLSTGARAIITATAVRFGGLSQRRAANDTNLYQARIAEASAILDWAPDLAEAVVSGTQPFSAALETARERKRSAEESRAKLDRLRAGAPDLASHVDDERMSLDDAIAALDGREEKARQDASKAEREERERAAVERDNARQANTELAKSVRVLDASSVPEWRARSVKYWGMGVCDAPPTATELVTPASLRRISEGLALLANELES